MRSNRIKQTIADPPMAQLILMIIIIRDNREVALLIKTGGQGDFRGVDWFYYLERLSIKVAALWPSRISTKANTSDT